MAGIKRLLEVIACSGRLEMPANSNVNVTESTKPCPFCSPFPQRILIEGSEAMATERYELLRLADDARQIVIERHSPDGFNLGINDGMAAGQSVPHLHLHLIPRFRGDTPDPRGGVRWVIPDRAAYWNRS